MAGFSGQYYKHQKGANTVCVISGSSMDKNFVQVVTNGNSYIYNFAKHEFSGCVFEHDRLILALPDVKGEISYGEFSPLGYDIMGPFKHLPMQCKHKIVSMRHKISGHLYLKEGIIDLNDGIGYIEADSGRSFPKSYAWVQCNDFPQEISVMIAIAHIPFLFSHFIGCIAVLMHGQKQYRFATYLGAKIVTLKRDVLCIKQGKYVLEVYINPGKSQKLHSPIKGKMTGRIYESNSSSAVFKLYENSIKILDIASNNVSYENEGMCNFK